MVSHALRIVVSPAQMDNPPEFPSPQPPDWKDVVPKRVRDVIGKYHEVITNQSREVQVRQETDEETGEVISTYLEGVFRFDFEDDPSAMLDELEAKAVDADWYKIYYHICWHEPGGKNQCCDPEELARQK